jgi:hypothetical protein
MTNNHLGSSETIRETSFNFNPYNNIKPLHKNKINTSFLEWFIGFSEGDKSFVVSGNRLFFIINQKEIKILNTIRTHLGFGKVSIYNGYGRYVVADRKGVDRLVSIFNGNLLLDKTNKRFIDWLQVRNSYSLHNIDYRGKNNIKRLNDNSWLTGFIDALRTSVAKQVGTFNSVRITDKSSKVGFRVCLRFILDQKDELFVLEKIKQFLKTGFIIKQNPFPNPLKGKEENKSKQMETVVCCANQDKEIYMYRFVCTDQKSHEILISYLQKHPLKTLKKVSFLRFCAINRYLKNRESLPWEGKVLKRVERLITNTKK